MIDKSNLNVRWIIRRDLPEVMEIERSSFEFPWSEADFLDCLRERNCIGHVAEFRPDYGDYKPEFGDDKIVGFCIYELLKGELHILNFAVHQDHRRRGVGSALVDKLAKKLSQQGRNAITLEVRETNLDAQRFFRSVGFKAVGVIRDYYEDTQEDAYQMDYWTAAMGF